jgi:hypothetical protein
VFDEIVYENCSPILNVLREEKEEKAKKRRFRKERKYRCCAFVSLFILEK